MTIGKLSKLIDNIQPLLQPPRLYIGASNIGSACMRQIWYEYRGEEKESPISRHQRNMDIGTKFEGIVLDWLEDAGIQVTRPNPSNNYLALVDNELHYFRGHADALLPELNAVIDIKVIKSSSYKEFVRKGLKAWSQLYHAQLQAYMGMGDFPYAYLLALNKDSGELHDERVKFNAEYYGALKTRAELVHSAPSEPPRVSGNPAWYLCKMCRFRGVCHK